MQIRGHISSNKYDFVLIDQTWTPWNVDELDCYLEWVGTIDKHLELFRIGFLDDNCLFRFVFERVLFQGRPQTLQWTENMVAIDAFNVTAMTITNKTSWNKQKKKKKLFFWSFKEKIT